MGSGVVTWLKHEGLIKYFYDEKMLTLAYNVIMESLITMFLRKSEKLEELLINNKFIFLKVSTILNAMPGISQLKTLHVNLRSYKNSTSTNIIELMNALTSKLCPYLKQLNIKSYLPSDESDTLVNIIKSNEKLEKIELGSPIISRSIYVYNIPNYKDERTIRELFWYCGKTAEFELLKNEWDDNQTAYIAFYEVRATLLKNTEYTVKSVEEIIYIKIFPALKYVRNSLKETLLDLLAITVEE
ncbi:2526_t:CDS:2 [Dentiscutata heterogama]|uniref:2526_t:CDS:1 n=1 Tax=Dentiscutata heterogama TaxID=1316150 RepID=A0ACA9M242_9GLOM|nr:2526_t:CDS:2 [Dentiscutata heterogama]